MDSNTAKKIKSKDTSIELILRRELWKRGYRYRVNDKKVFGKPDIVFSRQKVAIFCDSEFWHGKKYLFGEKFKTNPGFWEAKIERNIKRDIEVNDILKSEGWTIVRFWGKDIKENSDKCINKVIKFLKEKQRNG